MKYLFAVAAAAALTTGCSHKDASTTDQTTTSSTSATAAADAGATDASSSSSSVSSAASAEPAAAATSTDAGARAAPAAASGAPFAAIDLPVYPGAERDADKGMSMSANGDNVKVDFYTSKDDSAAVVSWYKGHLPSDWQNFQMSTGGKTVGTFASPDHGDDGQSVVVTGTDSGGTQIQLSTKTTTK